MVSLPWYEVPAAYHSETLMGMGDAFRRKIGRSGLQLLRITPWGGRRAATAPLPSPPCAPQRFTGVLDGAAVGATWTTLAVSGLAPRAVTPPYPPSNRATTSVAPLQPEPDSLYDGIRPEDANPDQGETTWWRASSPHRWPQHFFWPSCLQPSRPPALMTC